MLDGGDFTFRQTFAEELILRGFGAIPVHNGDLQSEAARGQPGAGKIEPAPAVSTISCTFSRALIREAIVEQRRAAPLQRQQAGGMLIA